MNKMIGALAIVLASVGVSASAATYSILTSADPAVEPVDYAAYFNAPDFDLVNYQEGGLTITPIASVLGTLSGQQSGSFGSGCQFTCTDPWLSTMGEGIYYSSGEGAIISGTFGQTFSAMQLTLGDGKGILTEGIYLMSVVYEIYKDGLLLDGGAFDAVSGDTLLFSTNLGFDELWIGASGPSSGSTSVLEMFNDSYSGSTALDNVFAAAVPLPATLPLMLVGLAGLGWYGRRRTSRRDQDLAGQAA